MVMADAMVKMAWVAIVETTMSIERKVKEGGRDY
jgi:microcompartment protein CcmL/EutN